MKKNEGKNGFSYEGKIFYTNSFKQSVLKLASDLGDATTDKTHGERFVRFYFDCIPHIERQRHILSNTIIYNAIKSVTASFPIYTVLK